MAKINLGSVVGPQGPQGPPGADGADGAQGIPGPNEISQETSITGFTSGCFFYNDNGKVKGKSITANDIVDGAKKQSEINNEVNLQIGKLTELSLNNITEIPFPYNSDLIGFTISPSKITKIGNIVFLNLLFKRIDDASFNRIQEIGLLPVGYRPSASVRFENAQMIAGGVDVHPNGRVRSYVPNVKEWGIQVIFLV